ncbi:hypothetical protein GA0070609_5268 [Micromonospora echinaurantiaca]|uniref:Uncharacterized protein n=1 Tax=Micromonospora echinaurantiaca TaxID=47857 RepID=A0A1C5K1I6_9ACTN|nr:hypothetical protein GA0070609_5268 [Micromonospora echinaurantiaca]
MARGALYDGRICWPGVFAGIADGYALLATDEAR